MHVHKAIKAQKMSVRSCIEKMFNFRVVNVAEIDMVFFTKAMKAPINRIQTIMRIIDGNPRLSVHQAKEVEEGLFEFALIRLYGSRNPHPSFFSVLYYDKLQDLLINLNPNSRVQNKTLWVDVVENRIKPFFLAFLKPEQLHPERWLHVIKRKEQIENSVNDVKATSIYTCYRCKENKCTTTQMQLRSADEPMTIFVTCLVCGNTFTK